MINFTELNEGRVIQVAMSGRLAREDYAHFLPEVESLIARHGKISVLMLMAQDFHGWSASGLVEDVQFSMRHSRDIDRIAMVGDKKWERGMAVVCRPFTSAQIRFFEPSQESEARVWVGAEARSQAA